MLRDCTSISHRKNFMNVEQKQPGKLFVISGPSGSGKGTLTRGLLKNTNENVVLSISATTRKPGPGEVDGKDYFFISRDEFISKVDKGELLEYAVVFDNYYGTPAEPVKELLAEGKTVILEIDVQGGLQVFENMPEAKGILILPPSDEELEKRLQNRGRDSESVIQKRLEKARWEIDSARNSDRYENEIVNDDLARAIDKIVSIVTEKN